MALRARTFGIVWLAVVASLLTAAYACRAPTEVTVRIETELPCSTLKGVSIAVAPEASAAEERANTGFYAASTRQCDSESTVGTLVLTPGSTSFAFVVIAGIDRDSTACKAPDYAGCVVARRRLSFVENASLEVPVTITRDCVDVACNVETSCLRGNCKSSETLCQSSTCTQNVAATPDGGTPEGGSVDGGLDARTDGSGPVDAQADAADAADAGNDAGKFDGGAYQCVSSPGCLNDNAPCSCSGAVKVENGSRVTTMAVNCSAAGATCTCTIEGTLVKSVSNVGVCTPSKYGECCSGAP